MFVFLELKFSLKRTEHHDTFFTTKIELVRPETRIETPEIVFKYAGTEENETSFKDVFFPIRYPEEQVFLTCVGTYDILLFDIDENGDLELKPRDNLGKFEVSGTKMGEGDYF